MSLTVDAVPASVPEIAEQTTETTNQIPRLSSLYMYIAGSCNLACKHCWIVPTFQNIQAQGDETKGIFLSFSLIEKAIQQAKPLGLTTAKLTGGEPMLHPRFKDIVRYLHNEGLRLIIETNGTFIDDEMARLMHDCEMRAVSISLDGVTAETHDSLRGVPGSYDAAVNGIKALVNVGIHPQIICTLHRGNLSELEAMIELAEGLGCNSVKFNHVQKIGRGKRFGDNHGIALDELIHLYSRLKSEIIPYTPLEVFFDIPVAFHSISRLMKNLNSGCSIQNIIGILGTGDVALCGIGVTLPDLLYGNLETDNLSDIWYNHPRLHQLREQVPSQLEGICSECIHQYACQGHCIANNFHMAGRLNAPFQFCQRAEELGLFPASRKKL